MVLELSARRGATSNGRSMSSLPLPFICCFILLTALFAPLALLDSSLTERRLSDFVIAGRGRGSKSDAWKKRQPRSSLFGSANDGVRDYKLVQTVAVMSSSRKVDVVVPDSVAERRDEQKKVLRR